MIGREKQCIRNMFAESRPARWIPVLGPIMRMNRLRQSVRQSCQETRTGPTMLSHEFPHTFRFCGASRMLSHEFPHTFRFCGAARMHSHEFPHLVSHNPAAFHLNLNLVILLVFLPTPTLLTGRCAQRRQAAGRLLLLPPYKVLSIYPSVNLILSLNLNLNSDLSLSLSLVLSLFLSHLLYLSHCLSI
jgi:hypothetical protein